MLFTYLFYTKPKMAATEIYSLIFYQRQPRLETLKCFSFFSLTREGSLGIEAKSRLLKRHLLDGNSEKHSFLLD